MNKYMNYVFLGANIIVSICSAIVLGIFLSQFKYVKDNNYFTIYQNLTWTVAVPVLGLVVGFVLIGYYAWELNKWIKQLTTPVNPRLIEGFKWTCGATIINFIAPFVLSLTAIFTYDRAITTILLWVAFGLSALVSCANIGFTAYLNVGVAFQSLSREELKRISEEENKKFNLSKETKVNNKKTKRRQDDSASKNVKEEASAGGF